MNRRNFMQMIGCLPFLGFLKPVQAKEQLEKSQPKVVCLGEAPYTVPPNKCAYFDHATVEGGTITVWGYYL